MKIYQPGATGRRRVYVQPGAEFPTSEFLDGNGNAKLIPVEFVHGCAEVPDNLGRYMIDRNIAQSSPIILDMGLVV